jgi:hypothetical protein
VKRSFLLATLLLLSPLPATGQEESFAPLAPGPVPAPALERPVTLEAEAPLGEAVRHLLREVGMGLAYDRALPGVERPVSLRAKGEPAAGVALRLLEGSGLELRVAGEQAVLVRARPGGEEAAPRRAGGEAVRGTLVEDPDGRTIPGALVMLVDSAGTERAHALSDSAGGFRLGAPGPGRYTLRAERVGYAMTSSPVIAVRPGETVEHRLAVRVQAVRLEGLAGIAEPRCESRPAHAERTRMLWEEARKALAAAAWAQDAPLFTFQVRRWKRPLDLGTRRRKYTTAEISLVSAPRPFESLPAAGLAAEGYVRREGGETVYYIPDAHVLLSDEFLDGHCFGVVAGRSGWVGLSFEPVPGRRLPDVHGVLWLDPATAELREMVFGYTGLSGSVAREGAGGRVEFERLPHGAWIVRRWAVRMPVVEETAPVHAEAPSRPTRVLEVVEDGGEVVEITPRGRHDRVAAGTRSGGTGAAPSG